MGNPSREDLNQLKSDISQLKEQSLENQGHVVSRQSIEFTAGPIPSPEQLAKFEAIFPGAAKLIFENFNEESIHRRTLEKMVFEENMSVSGANIKAVEERIKSEKRGQYMAFFITISGMVMGLTMIMNGHEITGSLFSASALMPVILAFLGKEKGSKSEG